MSNKNIEKEVTEINLEIAKLKEDIWQLELKKRELARGDRPRFSSSFNISGCENTRR